MSNERKHHGGCHCGKVSYEVTGELSSAISCNCSICSKKGTLLSFVPAAQFKLEKGEGELTDYQFNKHVIHHLFCKTCGVTSFARGKGPDGQPMVAINIRCIEGADPDKLSITKYDGKSK